MIQGAATARIDLSALQHNYHVVRQHIPSGTQIMAMVKANAYGHGLLPVAKALTHVGVDGLGVATIEEAIALREAGIKTPVSVMTGFTTLEELRLIFKYQLMPVIHHDWHLTLLEKIDVSSNTIAVWMKLDTGMHRLGFSMQTFPVALERLSKIKAVLKPVRLMTHLADADNPDRQFTDRQLHTFFESTKSLPGLKSVCHSAGILAYPKAIMDIVRPGILLYGASPFLDRSANALHLKSVMTLRSRILAIKDLKKGDRIGYGGTWTCPEDMTIAVLGIGYGDGYPRHIKNGTPVLINSVCCPTIGRVSMDMLTVDIRRQPDCRIGDEVVLWGDLLPIETIAASSETISYELFCQLTRRVQFVYETE